MRPSPDGVDWRTKPTDRFVLRWIKVTIAARLSPFVARIPGIRPWQITTLGAVLGVAGGVLLALCLPLAAGVCAAVAQVLDAVDGQVARLTGRASAGGAFLDSILDRYADGAMVIGSVLYLAQFPDDLRAVPLWVTLLVGSLALIGSNAVSYSAARAEGLGLETGPPTRASKGTRMSIMILGALLTPLWSQAPLLAVCYLAIHPNAAVFWRIAIASKSTNRP